MNIHILTPFYRKYLLKTLIHYYSKMNIIWHPICDKIDIEPFKDNKLDWVRPLLCPPLKKGQQCYEKFNHWINIDDIEDNDFYGFSGDDDMFEEGLFDELRKVSDSVNVVYISNYRGDKIPNDGGAPHPVEPIIMKRIEQVAPCQIGLGEFFVRGKILRQVRFDNHDGAGDGRFAQNVGAMCWPVAGSVEFKPNWFVFGNFFQPGRHTDPKKFLKPTWKLPEIIE